MIGLIYCSPPHTPRYRYRSYLHLCVPAEVTMSTPIQYNFLNWDIKNMSERCACMHACILDTTHFDYSESTITWSCNIVFDPINVRTARINVEQRKRRLDHDKWPVYSGDDFHEFVINCAAEVDLLHGGKVYFCVETVLLGIDVACSQPMIKEAAGRVDTPVGVRGRWSSICPKPRGKKVKEYWWQKDLSKFCLVQQRWK